MMTTALDIVQTRIKAVLVALETGPGVKLFKNVYESGDIIDETQLPIAVIHYDEEVGKESTQKQMQTLPFAVEFKFAVAPAASPRMAGNDILSDVKKALSFTNRTLPGVAPTSAAIDTRYTGGGGAYVALTDEATGSKWQGVGGFETDYRHLTENPQTFA